MGCCASTPKQELTELPMVKPSRKKKLKRPMWTSDEVIDTTRLQKMREEFWDTQPHYGGESDVWMTLKAACEQEELATAQTFLDAADIKVTNSDMTSFYDSRGFEYNLPKYVVSEPTNLDRR